MTPTASMLDVVDRAFLFHADQSRRHPAPGIPAIIPPAVPESPTTMPPAVAAAPVPIADTPPTAPADDGPGALVERLLRVVPDAWTRLATRVEDAHREGAEVIAIAGGRRGEGRTTLVACLARTLASRGWRVECHESVPLELPPVGHGGGRIVLVDAGVWFPGGPLRRAWLERQSLGCHAVILVRRAAEPACAARGATLEAVGVRVLGEVLTMAPPATSGIQVA